MDRRSAILASLESGMNRTIAFFDSLDPVDLDIQVYTDGAQWTVKQVLAHFVAIEKSMHWLFGNILDGGPGSPQDFDVDRFNRRQTARFDDHSVDELIRQFGEVRRETMRIVGGMSDGDLDRQGWHVYHGRGRLERFIRWAYEHDQAHEEDIKTVLDSAKGAGR